MLKKAKLTNKTMKKFTHTLIALTALLLYPNLSHGQDNIAIKFGDGVTFNAPDSSFSLQLRGRFQTLYNGSLDLETDEWSDQMLIRRTRLKFDGFAYDPRLVYKLELALSNRDNGRIMEETNMAANIVLDAVLKYKFAPGWQLWFGQTKLPGNRERVISSQQLQFVDRSQLNSRFTIDRGTGIQLRHEHRIGKGVVREMGAVSMGDGRNVTINNIGGYEFTGRIEYLPFGKFIGGGDYFGADLAREPKPKLSIAATYDQNNNAPRARGNKGDFLNQHKDLKTVFVDAMFKYQGFSLMFEYADRQNDGSPVTPDGNFYTGTGVNVQMGYVFANNFEVAGRYTEITPEEISGFEAYNERTLGLSKYIVGHSLKVQSDITHIDNSESANELRFRFQVELAF